MRLLIFVLALPFFGASQVAKRPSFKRHFLEISPINVTFNKGFFYNHQLKYRFLITQKFYAEAGTFATVFKRLDMSYNPYQKGIHPLFNESMAVIGYLHSLNPTDENKSNNVLGAHLGYHYIQYSHKNNSSDYEIINEIPGGYRKLGGYKVHSLKAGISFQNILYDENTEKPSVKRRHFVSLSYLCGLGFVQPTYNEYSEDHVGKSINLNQFTWKYRSGFAFEYSFEHSISKHIGLIYGCSLTWAPRVNYQPDYNLFVPRGSEVTIPVFSSIRIGITIQ